MKCRFKKSISLICALVLIISVLSLSACGKDKKSIIGTWVGNIGHFDYSNGITFYKDGSFTLTYDDPYFSSEGVIDGTYNIIRDGTAIQLNRADRSYNSTIIMEYKLLSNNRLVFIIDGREYTLQREK